MFQITIQWVKILEHILLFVIGVIKSGFQIFNHKEKLGINSK